LQFEFPHATVGVTLSKI